MLPFEKRMFKTERVDVVCPPEEDYRILTSHLRIQTLSVSLTSNPTSATTWTIGVVGSSHDPNRSPGLINHEGLLSSLFLPARHGASV